MKGGKMNNSGLLSATVISPSHDIAVDHVVNSEKLPQKKGVAEMAVQEERDVEKLELAEGFYEMEAIRRKRIQKGKVQYLIKWQGWPESTNTWEPVENLLTCYDVVLAYEKGLMSAKQRSVARKRKQKHRVTHTEGKGKEKQQQEEEKHSPADATYNVPAVNVRMIERPVPSPPVASLNVTDHVASNGNEVANANDEDMKLSEPKGVRETKETSVDGVPSAFSTVIGTESVQSGRLVGAKRRKSAFVRRFKLGTTSGRVNNPQGAVGYDGFVAAALHCTKCGSPLEDTSAITEIIHPLSYSAPHGLKDASVTFLAKRSDGREATVNNKFLKINNPLLLINYYEQHLRFNPVK